MRPRPRSCAKHRCSIGWTTRCSPSSCRIRAALRPQVARQQLAIGYARSAPPMGPYGGCSSSTAVPKACLAGSLQAQLRYLCMLRMLRIKRERSQWNRSVCCLTLVISWSSCRFRDPPHFRQHRRCRHWCSVRRGHARRRHVAKSRSPFIVPTTHDAVRSTLRRCCPRARAQPR